MTNILEGVNDSSEIFKHLPFVNPYPLNFKEGLENQDSPPPPPPPPPGVWPSGSAHSATIAESCRSCENSLVQARSFPVRQSNQSDHCWSGGMPSKYLQQLVPRVSVTLKF